MEPEEVLRLIEEAAEEAASDIPEEAASAAARIALLLDASYLAGEIMQLLQERLNALLERAQSSK